MKRTPHRALIVGAGKIGSGYDRPGAKEVITHAHAIAAHPRIELAGFVDVDPVRRAREAKKWGTRAWGDLALALRETEATIVVIATPNETHERTLIEVLSASSGSIRAIVMEKPVTTDDGSAKRVRAAARKAKVPIVVNYRRRFDPAMERLRAELITGKYGGTLSARALYTKGILHNGSHMIDLARHLFGEFERGSVYGEVDDLSGGEPTISGIATFERCPEFHLMAGDERSFYVFELEIVTEKARIAIIDEGRAIAVEPVVRDPRYSGSRTLGARRIKATELHLAMKRMIDHVVRVAEGSIEPHSSLENAIRTEEACRALLAEKQKRHVRIR